MDSMIGKRLRKDYEIQELIGTGGMARVYKARHTYMQRDFAVKILDPKMTEIDSTVSKRFLLEAQACFDLEHPNIVKVYDYGIEDGITFLIMRYIEGKTLKKILAEEGRQSIDQIKHILNEVASAIDYSHSCPSGGLHRDIKPSNIIISEDRKKVVLCDFGVGKFKNQQEALTVVGMHYGTPEYMSPEQARGHELTKASDIYSLGIVVFEMLTGKVPFSSNRATNTLLKHLNEPVPDPAEYWDDTPDHARWAVMKALAKSPNDRYNSAEEFAEAFRKPKKIHMDLKHDNEPFYTEGRFNEFSGSNDVKEEHVFDKLESSHNQQFESSDYDNSRLKVMVITALIIAAVLCVGAAIYLTFLI